MVFKCVQLIDSKSLEILYKTIVNDTVAKERNLEIDNTMEKFDFDLINLEIGNIMKKFDFVEIEAEGKIIERYRNPPGQKSVYIFPGDTSEESYRLSTFFHFPKDLLVDLPLLAKAGFFYTGYKDRVKCFVCSNCVEHWTPNDGPKDAHWHQSNCALIKGEEGGNYPLTCDIWKIRCNSASSNLAETTRISQQPPEFSTIASVYFEQFLQGLDLCCESDRLKSFNLWPPYNVSHYDLAQFGFFYLGNLDRCQCFSCLGVLENWNFNSNVANEHKRYFPDCRMVQGIEANNISLPHRPRLQMPARSIKSERALICQTFPCLYPVNPHMNDELDRLVTFDLLWPSDKVIASPLLISLAGFYFLGERDRVKCWYCNGGLENWEPLDEPWTEHAKWFPRCEFLLQQKGPDYVRKVVELFPYLHRPVLSNGCDVPPSFRPTNSASFAIIDPMVEIQSKKEKLEEMNSEVAKSAEDMGFSCNSGKKNIKKKTVRRRKHVTEIMQSG